MLSSFRADMRSVAGGRSGTTRGCRVGAPEAFLRRWRAVQGLELGDHNSLNDASSQPRGIPNLGCCKIFRLILRLKE